MTQPGHLSEPAVRQTGVRAVRRSRNGLSDSEDGERYRAPALDKGLDILELLSDVEDGRSQTEIAKALGRAPTEIFRMLDRLVRRGYVARTAEDRYELTLKLFGMAHRHSPTHRLVSRALPLMQRFAREAEQACHLAVYDRGSVIVVAQVDSPGYWSFAVRVGSHISLLNTGSGRVLLAFATPEERALMLDQREVMAHEIRPDDLDARLEEARIRGHEMMPSQQTIGVVNISVPVLDPSGRALAALTCPYLQRLDTDAPPSREAALDMLLAAAETIGGAGRKPSGA